MLLLLTVAAALAGCEDRSTAEAEAVSKALSNLVPMARASTDPSEIVARVRKLVDDDGVCSPAQRTNAAMVLMEGSPDDQELAYELAASAYEEEGLDAAARTAMRAMDRSLVGRGEPQHYGTMRGTQGSAACLYEMDEDFDDEDRLLLGSPPLEEVLAAFAADVGYTGALSMEAMEEAEVLCGAVRAEETSARDGYGSDGTVDVRDGAVARGRFTAKLRHGELYGHFGEWSGNAYTLNKGEMTIRPFMRSAFGVADGVQLGTSFLGWGMASGGPLPSGGNAHLEVAPVQNEHGAVSVEGGFVMPLYGRPPLWQAYAEAKATVYLSPKLSTTVAVQGLHNEFYGIVDGTQVNVKGALEISFDTKTVLVLSGRGNVLATRSFNRDIGAGAYIAMGGGKLATSLGINVDTKPEDLVVPWTGASWLVYNFPVVEDPFVVVVPQLQLWYRPHM